MIMITMDNISKSVIMLTPFCKKESGKANAIFDLPAGSMDASKEL